MNTEELFTLSQIAERFGRDISNVLRWYQKGLFPNAQRIGGTKARAGIVLIPAGDLEGFEPPARGVKPKTDDDNPRREYMREKQRERRARLKLKESGDS